MIHFCAACARKAGKCGHAIRGTLGYGRACVAACRAAGQASLTYLDVGRAEVTVPLPKEGAAAAAAAARWPVASPIRSADAAMILSYAAVMLTTNLHSPKVKQKMTVSEFLRQNRGLNDGGDFPGDFLAAIYDDIRGCELKVMPTAPGG